MSADLQFDLLRFRPLSWLEFLRRYVGTIQPQVAWDRLDPPRRSGLRLVQPSDRLFMVWYRNGDWRDGEPREAKLGSALALTRLPALRVRGRYVVLDGCHRLSEVRPAVVLLDWIEPKRKDWRYFTDLFNEAYRSWPR